MENLLSMPVRPLEVMLGKIVPFVVVGYIQVAVILLAGKLLFGVPVLGSLWLLSLALVLFIAANLAVGFTFSTMAENQLQAMQMTFFFFLPSLLLSGFLFPFRGMPDWAHAGLGVPADPFPADRARHSAEGQRLERDRARDLADRGVHAGRGRGRAQPLPRNAGLTAFRSEACADWHRAAQISSRATTRAGAPSASRP